MERESKLHEVFMDYDPIYPEGGRPFDTDVSDESVLKHWFLGTSESSHQVTYRC